MLRKSVLAALALVLALCGPAIAAPTDSVILTVTVTSDVLSVDVTEDTLALGTVDVSQSTFSSAAVNVQNTGTVNLWRGMIYGLTGRVGGREHIWKLWDDFGIADADWLGYWDAACPVRTDCKDVLATVYRKPGTSLIALATWSRRAETVTLKVDWKALGLDPKRVRVHAPAIKGMQEAQELKVGQTLAIPPGGGHLILAQKR